MIINHVKISKGRKKKFEAENNLKSYISDSMNETLLGGKCIGVSKSGLH